MSTECPYESRQPPIRIDGYFASPRTFPRSLLVAAGNTAVNEYARRVRAGECSPQDSWQRPGARGACSRSTTVVALFVSIAPMIGLHDQLGGRRIPATDEDGVNQAESRKSDPIDHRRLSHRRKNEFSREGMISNEPQDKQARVNPQSHESEKKSDDKRHCCQG